MDEQETTQTSAQLLVLTSVRCLGCGAVYSKPSGGGTACSNPGCPHCGYVGWASTSKIVTEAPLLTRFGAGPLRRRLA
jgi:hypothetical protein